MGDYPDRAVAKHDIKLKIDAQLKNDIVNLAALFKASSSRTVECIIFMAQHEYETDKDCKLIKQMRQLKARRFSSSPSLASYPQESRWHLTIDRDALDFCHMLTQKYPLIFDSLSMCICLCLAYARHTARGGAEPYLVGRLNEVMVLHPVRKPGSKPALQ